MAKSISLTTPYCKVTGRRHRVSPCRSAYFASSWWLLTLELRRRSREAALLFPESWWHLTMWGSRPSLFMIIPNTKRHPNNTKTDQLPISEVITALPRPYHNRHVCHRSMGACGVSFSLRVLVSKCMRTSRWCVSCGNMKFMCIYQVPHASTRCLL